MHRSFNLVKCAIFAIALFASTFVLFGIQAEAFAQTENG